MTSPTVRLLRAFAVVALPISAVVGCSGSTGPAGPSLTGSWEGTVALHDEFGAPLASDSGIVVTTSPLDISGASNSAGNFTLAGLKTGDYTLTYAGAGFGTYLRPQLGFVGGSTQDAGLSNLSQQSTGVITGLAITPAASGDTLILTGSITAPPGGVGRYFRVFYASAASVSSAVGNYVVTGPSTGAIGYRTASGTLRTVITNVDLQALRNAFASGSTVYAIAYGDSYYENSYTDPASGMTVYPNVSATPSAVVTFTMP